MSIKDLENLIDRFEGFGEMCNTVSDIRDELEDSGLNTELNRKVLKDVVMVLKKGVEMMKIRRDVKNPEMDDLIDETVDVMNEFFMCACYSIGGCGGGGSGRGKGGKGLGKNAGVSDDDYKETKKQATDAIKKAIKIMVDSNSKRIIKNLLEQPPVDEDEVIKQLELDEMTAKKSLPGDKKKAANDALDKFFKRAGVILKASPKKASPKKASPKPKTARCPRGTHRNKKTGNCESTGAVSQVQPVKDHVSSPKAKAKTARCPRGSRRNKKTGNCDKN